MDRTKELGEGRIGLLIARFALPSVVGMVVSSLYNIVDRIFIGRGVGPLALAGVTVAFGLQLIQIAFAVLVGIGTSARISLSLGQGRKDKAERFLGNGFAINLAISVVLAALGIVFLDPLLRVFGASEEVLPYARSFTFIVLLGTPLGTISMGLNGFIRAEGNPKVAMVTQLIGPALNLFLCPFFIFVLKLGVAGSALANVISMSVGSAWVLAYYLSGKSVLKIRRENLVLSREFVLPILILGLPNAFSNLASSITMGLMNNQLVRHGGDMAVTAMGIVFAISNLALMTLVGTSMGMQPLIGYNIGAKLFDRARKIEVIAVGAATVFVSALFAVIQLFPGAFVSLFAGSNSEVGAIGVYALRRYFMFLPLMGLQVLGSGYFQAAGKPMKSLVLGLTRQFIVLIPMIVVLPLLWGLDGVWSAQPVADVIAFTITGIVLWRELRSLDRMAGAALPRRRDIAAVAPR